MGYVTLIRVYNDATNDINDNQKEFVEGVIRALSSGQGSEYGVGHHCNAVKVFPSVHSNDSSMYILHGNAVTEINPYSKGAEKLMKGNPEYFGEILRMAKDKISQLEKIFADSQKPKTKRKPLEKPEDKGLHLEF
jgi:hypothetical protein